MEKDAFVSVLNDADLEGPPTMMEYINSYKVHTMKSATRYIYVPTFYTH